MRYQNDDGTINEYAEKVLTKYKAQVTYAGFEEFFSGKKARDAFQIKGPEVGPDMNGPMSWSDSRIRARFDTLQLYKNGIPEVRIPFSKGDTEKTTLEPFTNAYPQYGTGGAQQIHLDRRNVNLQK